MTSLAKDIARYESWLRGQCKVVEVDLAAKHERMRESPFDFLRATYFRWARTIESTCPGFSKAPRVLCVGDIHVENFGIWRDADGRQVWGVNDFDEAAVMPYAYDLVRLMTSIRLAPKFRADAGRAAGAVLKGYVEALGAPRPMLLDQGAPWFRTLVARLADTSGAFWQEIEGCERASPPRAVARALRRSLPKGAKLRRFATRRKGGGSLGRPRYLALAEWQGGGVVREAKAMVPSAWEWAHSKVSKSLRFLELAYGENRSPDPSLALAGGYLLRRVAADARKLDVKEVAKQGLGVRLLEAMGADLGSIHAMDARAPKILGDLMQRDRHWLHAASEVAEQAVQNDYREFRAAGSRPSKDNVSSSRRTG